MSLHRRTRRATPVLWLFGPPGVGKSTVGQTVPIGFCAAVAPNVHWLKARNLAAVWENYRAAGAQTLVAVGPVRGREDPSVYEAVLPRAAFKWFRLHAGPSELARRMPAVAT